MVKNIFSVLKGKDKLFLIKFKCEIMKDSILHGQWTVQKITLRGHGLMKL